MGILVLMRHSKSDYPLGVPDHERPLAKRGHREAPLMAPLLDRELADSPTVLVLVSDAVRTQQTWECVSDAWERDVRVETAPEIYEAEVSAIADRIRRVGTGVDTAGAVIVVGHNPGLEETARALVGNKAPERFPTSAFAVLECDEPWETFDRGVVRLRAFHIAR
jgi:phosphohistidine phosphatase